MNLPQNIERYSRQLILKDWSLSFQRQLADASIAVDTTLPSCALYLAAAGIGHLILQGPDDLWLRERVRLLNPATKICADPRPVNCAISIDPELLCAYDTTILVSSHALQYRSSLITRTLGLPTADLLFSGAAAATFLLLLWHSEIA